ncbi:cupin domain-containing protein [Acidimicrobiia bacterium EGI L10123]|uniref:cupin domain-containing protein n=1 Tax=Salinilacustrithrix flava TaxID=2957203 RepID=UPI003D7C2092|nr:cupin domain-containing protein [Acidimicrobiia bacterium EGI L10123]
MTVQSPAIIARDEGQRFHFLGNLYTAKLDAEHTDGAMTVMEFLAPRGFGPPLHRHDVEDEVFYLIEGDVWFSCGDVEAVHSAGAVVWLPRGRPHTFQVRSETARVLQVSTPAQFERFVATLGRPTEATGLPEPEEVDPAHVAEVCAQFSIEVLGPPPDPALAGVGAEVGR